MPSNLKSHDVAYLAGLFDGEGYVGIGKHTRHTEINHTPTYTLRVSIANLCKEVLVEFREKTGLGNNKMQRLDSCYGWHIQCNQAAQFLEMVLPYLRIKKQQALFAIEFQKMQKSERRQGRWTGGCKSEEAIAVREMYKQTIQSLNKRDSQAFYKKSGELLETLERDNQKPSLSNVLKLVDRKAHRLTGEDTQTDKPDTSAGRESEDIVGATG